MITTLTCADADAAGMIERYLAKRLGGAELERFEEHLFECDRCQEELRLGVAVRSGLRRFPALALTGRRARRWWLPGIALAATLAALLLLPGQDGADLRGLGDVAQPPLYVGLAVRAVTTPADSAFAAAMSAYTAGAYRPAAVELRDALELGAPPAPAGFFLGSSLLMLGDAAAAADAFADVIALGESPYLPEAHYYRAKALLRIGRRGAALEELGRAEAAGGRIAAPAAALADSVRIAPGP